MAANDYVTLAGLRALMLSGAGLMLAQAVQAQDAPEIPPIPAIVVPDFIGVDPAQKKFEDALGDRLGKIDGLRIAPARCDDQGAVVPGLGVIVQDQGGIAADLGDKGTYVIEKGGAGAAEIGGAQFVVAEDGSGAIRRQGAEDQQITVEADGAGTYLDAHDQITLDGQGGGSWRSDRMGQITIEPDGSGTWDGPMGRIINEGNGSGAWSGTHTIINDGDGHGTVDGQDVAMEPLPPVPPAGKFPLLTTFKVPPAACGYLITLDDRILFDFDKSDLRPDAAQTVDVLATALVTVAPKTLQVRGHTDAKGSDDYNRTLSQKRADTVTKALEDRAVPGQITAQGFGESQPVARNDIDGKDNPAGRQLNRRVEIFVPN